jgi:hypothetical protein
MQRLLVLILAGIAATAQAAERDMRVAADQIAHVDVSGSKVTIAFCLGARSDALSADRGFSLHIGYAIAAAKQISVSEVLWSGIVMLLSRLHSPAQRKQSGLRRRCGTVMFSLAHTQRPNQLVRCMNASSLVFAFLGVS